MVTSGEELEKRANGLQDSKLAQLVVRSLVSVQWSVVGALTSAKVELGFFKQL